MWKGMAYIFMLSQFFEKFLNNNKKKNTIQTIMHESGNCEFLQ